MGPSQGHASATWDAHATRRDESRHRDSAPSAACVSGQKLSRPSILLPMVNRGACHSKSVPGCWSPAAILPRAWS